MFSCGRCNSEFNDGALCSLCQRYFDFPCAGITESNYRRLGKNKSIWKCPQCKSGNTVQSGQEEGGLSPTAVTLEKLHEQLLNITAQLAPLQHLKEDVKAIKSDIAEFKDSLQFAHESISKFSERIDTLETNINQLQKLADTVPMLQADITRLNSDKHERDQWMRMNNVEIKGVPIKTNENLFDIALKLGSLLECPIKKEDINMITRVPTYQKDTPKPIIVSFINRYTKEDFVAAMRKRKHLTPNALGLSGTNSIYVNDHLTPYYKQLLTKAKSLQKSAANFQYIWVKHSKIWARKSMTSKTFTINSDSDLQKIC